MSGFQDRDNRAALHRACKKGLRYLKRARSSPGVAAAADSFEIPNLFAMFFGNLGSLERVVRMFASRIQLSALAAILLASSAPTLADPDQGWVKTSSTTAGTTNYVSRSRVSVYGDYIRFWVLSDYPRNDPQKWKQSKTYYEGDCAEMKERILQITVEYWNGTTDSENEPGEWNFVTPNSTGESDLQFACRIANR